MGEMGEIEMAAPRHCVLLLVACCVAVVHCDMLVACFVAIVCCKQAASSQNKHKAGSARNSSLNKTNEMER